MSGLYSERFGSYFANQLLGLDGAAYSVVRCAIENLRRFPLMGSEQSDLDQMLDVPFPIRKLSIPDVHLQLFYSCDERTQTVICLYLWDSRRNPANKFAGLFFD